MTVKCLSMGELRTYPGILDRECVTAYVSGAWPSKSARGSVECCELSAEPDRQTIELKIMPLVTQNQQLTIHLHHSWNSELTSDANKQMFYVNYWQFG